MIPTTLLLLLFLYFFFVFVFVKIFHNPCFMDQALKCLLSVGLSEDECVDLCGRVFILLSVRQSVSQSAWVFSTVSLFFCLCFGLVLLVLLLMTYVAKTFNMIGYVCYLLPYFCFTVLILNYIFFDEWAWIDVNHCIKHEL